MEENKKNNSNLKAAIVLLLLLLLGSVGYIYKMSNDVDTVKTELKTEIKTVMSEKESVISDLNKLKETYDTAIAENSSMSNELIKEREKVVTLIKEVKTVKTENVTKYKTQLLILQNNLKQMMAENVDLKKQNTVLVSQRDSTKTVLEETQKSNEELKNKFTELAKTIEESSALVITDLKAAAFKLRDSGRQMETEKSSRADIIKVTFTVAENKIAKAGIKTFYIQIIDSENNIVGEKKTESFGSKSLDYSFRKNIKYENNTITLTEDVPSQKFIRGTYTINVFDKTVLVSKTSIQLR